MKKRLTILHTNDLHANYDFVLRQATYIKKRVKELEAQDENYLLLDGGDHLDMSINECLATEGQMHLEMIADVGYHAMSVGNNEILRSTPELVRKHSLETKVPWLMLNLVEGDGSTIGGMKHSLLLDAGEGMKVGLFGATDQFDDLYENKHGFKNKDTLAEVKKAAKHLKDQGADLILFMSHLGYEADLQYAKELAGMIDVIIGGHTHTVLERPVVESGVIIVQAGSHGKFVGELILEIDDGAVGQFEGKLVEIDENIDCDPSMSEILERGRKQTEAFFSKVLSYSSTSLSHDDVVKLMAEAVREFWDAEVGIMYGGAAVKGFEKGELTRGMVLESCRSMHSPVLIEMTGEQIAGLVRDRFREDITSKQVYGNGFRPHGIEIGALGFSGVTWTLAEGEIVEIMVNERPLEADRVYSVGSGTPLLYAEVCGYPSVEGGNMTDISNTMMVKDVFMSYLKKTKELVANG